MPVFFGKSLALPRPEEALPGRAEPLPVPERHLVLGTRLRPPHPEGLEVADFAMGCFWGAERLFWRVPGVHTTAVGYQGGFTPNPTYEEVCTGRTGHAEAVRVVFDPTQVSYPELLRLFFESHDPTQGMRQGADVGTQYRSAIFTHGEAQSRLARAARELYGEHLKRAGLGPITTEVAPAPPFYFAEGYHQQYLHRNPGGYCGLAGTGVPFPVEELAQRAGSSAPGAAAPPL